MNRRTAVLLAFGFLAFSPGTHGIAQVAGTNAATMAFVKIQPGTFMMGCVSGDTQCDDDEKPAHLVHLTRAFEMAKTEVTQAQWKEVMGTDPSNFKGDSLPVEQVNWNDINQFLNKMNARNDGFRYRLPSEAEWEYAARAGSAGIHLGPTAEISWFMENSDGKTHAVGTKLPNAWGLYDMEGNVYELVQDWYGDYSKEPVTDPTGFTDGSDRVPRGGSWMSTAKGTRLSNRNFSEPQVRNYNVGFRCVREAIR